MKISWRQAGNVCVVDMEGDLKDSHVSTFSVFMCDLLSSRGPLKGSRPINVLINMVKVQSIDSMGICRLVTFKKDVADRGGRLVLCSLTEGVKLALKVTQLERNFEIFEDEARALATFRG